MRNRALDFVCFLVFYTKWIDSSCAYEMYAEMITDGEFIGSVERGENFDRVCLKNDEWQDYGIICCVENTIIYSFANVEEDIRRVEALMDEFGY